MNEWISKKDAPEEFIKEMESWSRLAGKFLALSGKILFHRGIKTRAEAEKFLAPDYERDLGDPFDILGMDVAVERILTAIKNNERIVVFGDYDADGVCATAIFNDFFKKIGFENFHIHIPDRYAGGYGLTMEAIEEFAGKSQKNSLSESLVSGPEPRASLIVTLDCGITDYEEVERAREFGMDVVVIDHHLVPEKPPLAVSIVDVKQSGDNYPFKDFCGSGIAFKTVCALLKKGRDRGQFSVMSGWEKWLLDLVAIATIADMVSLTGENRMLVSFGLKVLRKTQRQGIIALCKRQGLSLINITEDDLGFTIAPRINTASRMGHANTSFNLLVTQSRTEAEWISGHLEEMNVDRKQAVEDILKEIDERIVLRENNLPAIVITGDEKWFPGVLGIAANRLMEKYQCPIFLWGKGESKEIKGSCRCPAGRGINLVELMGHVPKDSMIDFGGHLLAGGFSVTSDKIEEFEKGVREAFEKIPKTERGGDILEIDSEEKIDDIDWNFYSVIEKFQPFGKDNEKPIFCFKNLPIANIKKFGNGGIHLQLDFTQNRGKTPLDSARGKISAIGFFIAEAEKFAGLEVGQTIDLAATLEKSTFRATPELRLRIVDVIVKN